MWMEKFDSNLPRQNCDWSVFRRLLLLMPTSDNHPTEGCTIDSATDVETSWHLNYAHVSGGIAWRLQALLQQG